MQFLQSLLSRRTASIPDSALDNDHLNSDANTPYPNSIAIDDSSDDEQVTTLMQDVDNVKGATFQHSGFGNKTLRRFSSRSSEG